jgi:hypothetical protein
MLIRVRGDNSHRLPTHSTSIFESINQNNAKQVGEADHRVYPLHRLSLHYCMDNQNNHQLKLNIL